MKEKPGSPKKSQPKEDPLDPSLPGYPLYPDSEDIFNKSKEESEIDPENIAIQKKSIPREKKGTPNEKDFDEDFIGDDLDVPGAPDEIEDEDFILEDEENDYYSLGGDDHNDLEEDLGEDIGF